MITYGGVPLLTVTAAAAAWVEAGVSVRDVYEFARLHWPGRWPEEWPVPQPCPELSDLGVVPGRLVWPTGASRWAVYHGLAAGEDLERIRQAAYAGTGRYRALPLALDDEAGGRIETDLYLLPPRPLAQVAGIPAGESQLYLLTLVDERFFWWQAAAEITVAAGMTTWAGLLETIAGALGVVITPDTIDSAYLEPGPELSAHHDPLPPLLDAVCASIGHRLVRQLDGKVRTQGPRLALAAQDLQALRFDRQAGGLFLLDGRRPPHDLQALAPAEVRVAFPDLSGGTPSDTPYTVTVPLLGLRLPEYAGTPGRPGTQVLRSGAAYGGGNAAELAALAGAMARDWYLWLLGRQTQVYAGVAAYLPEGASDRVLWTAQEGAVCTRAERGAWPPGGVTLPPVPLHGSAGSAKECCGTWTVTNSSGLTQLFFPLQTVFMDTVTIDVIGTTTESLVIAPPAASTADPITVYQPGTTTNGFTVTPQTTVVVVPATTTANAIQIDPPTSYTGNAIEITKPGDTATNTFTVGPTGGTTIFPSTDVVPLTLRAATGGSSHIQEWKDNAGNVVASMDEDGNLTATGVSGALPPTPPTTVSLTAVPTWFLVDTVTHADLTDADGEQDITVYTLPAKAAITGAVWVTKTAGSGGGVGSLTVDLRLSGVASGSVALNGLSANAQTGFVGAGFTRQSAVSSWTAGTDVIARFNADVNVADLTGGEWEVYLLLSKLG